MGWLKKLLAGPTRDRSFDPGPSPIPWLSDERWRVWKSSDDEAVGCPLIDPQPVVVSEDDRARAPIHPIPEGASLPPEGTLAEQHERLLTTKAEGRLELQRWPICCSRLGTLLHVDFRELEKVSGTLNHAYMEQEILEDWPKEALAQVRKDGIASMLDPIRRGDSGDDGASFFQCRACGRLYVGAYHP